MMAAIYGMKKVSTVFITSTLPQFVEIRIAS